MNMLNSLPNRRFTITVKKIGAFLCGWYFLFAYISCSSLVPQAITKGFLYSTVLLGLFVFVYKHILTNLYIKWYCILLLLSFFSAITLDVFCNKTDWFVTIYQMLIVLLLANALTMFIDTIEDVKKIGIMHVVGAVCLMGLLLFTGELHVDERLGTTATGNANTFATMFMVALMYAIWISIFESKVVMKILFSLAAVIIMYGLLLSGGRKFIIAPIIFMYTILMFKEDSKGRKHIIVSSLLIVSVVVGLWLCMLNIPELYQSVGWRMEAYINSITGHGIADGSSILRKKLRFLAFIEGTNSPIFGHGFDSFKYLASDKLNFYAYSHNNWTEMWYNGGIIGLIVYYYIYIKILVNGWKCRAKCQAVGLFCVACVISLFVLEYGAVTYFQNQIQLLLCICVILLNCVEKGDCIDVNQNSF